MTSFTLTPDDYRHLLMTRIQQSLADNGVVLDDATLRELESRLPLPDDGTIQVGPVSRGFVPQQPVQRRASNLTSVRPTGRKPASGRAVDHHLSTHKAGQVEGPADKRARAYTPTPKARVVNSPAKTDDRIINAIIANAKAARPCLLSDLRLVVDGKPDRAIYNALWRLKKARLIEVKPALE